MDKLAKLAGIALATGVFLAALLAVLIRILLTLLT